MRGANRKGLSRWPLAAALLLAACASAPSSTEGPHVEQTAAATRAERRAYDGAPPISGHEDFGIECTSCHVEGGIEIEDIGVAPAMPHARTPGMSDESRCQQCHVFRVTDEVFVASRFVGLPQDLRSGRRLNAWAPPTIPHKLFMRENCAACHTGPAARDEIRTTHPERVRCRQCHVPADAGVPAFP